MDVPFQNGRGPDLRSRTTVCYDLADRRGLLFTIAQCGVGVAGRGLFQDGGKTQGQAAREDLIASGFVCLQKPFTFADLLWEVQNTVGLADEWSDAI